MAIYRDGIMIVPGGTVVIEEKDRLILGAHFYEAEDDDIVLTELKINSENPWVGKKIRDLDFSRKELIVRVRRKNNLLVPNGDTQLKAGDSVLFITKRMDE